MPVIGCKLSEDERSVEEDDDGLLSYIVSFHIFTSGGGAMGAVSVANGASAIVGGGNVPFPLRGQTFNYWGDSDPASFCKRRTVKQMDKEHPDIWIGKAFFSPLRDGETSAQYTNPHPKNWPVRIWTEWVQGQKNISKGKCLTNLPGLNLGPLADDEDEHQPHTPNDIVEVVNAAGQQTIDPIVENVYFPRKHVMRYYPSQEVIDYVNLRFMNTANSNVPFFTATDKRVWRYEITQAEKTRVINVPGIGAISYVPATTIFLGQPETHDKFILNNGMAAFRKNTAGDEYLDTPEHKHKIYPIMLPSDDEEEDEQQTSEPLNLNLDGTFTPGIAGKSIRWQHLAEDDYSGFLVPFASVDFPWP